MRTLVYKRTHNGDPDEFGQFGSADCMQSVRSKRFDAVIGIGGMGKEAKGENIDGKVNWIGIGPHKELVPGFDHPIVTFDHFHDYGTEGPELRIVAPALAELMYDRGGRVVLNFTEREEEDIERLLAEVADAPPSKALAPRKRKKTAGKPRVCPPRRKC